MSDRVRLSLQSPGVRILVGVLLFGVLGCSSGSGAKTTLTGKVTFGGQGVGGLLVFNDETNKEVGVAPISGTDGSYTAKDLPTGTLKVYIRPLPPVGGAMTKDSKMPGSEKPPGATPPAKYTTVAGGLSVTIAAGEQKKDFELAP